MLHIKGEHLFPVIMTRGDLLFVTILFGFFLGFGWFVIWHAINETRRTKRVNTYVVLIWTCLIASYLFAILTWLFLEGTIIASFWAFFWVLVCWAIQINCLLQIIVNRICILIPNPSKRLKLKLIIAALTVLINISVFVCWIPDHLFISEQWHKINNVWDRIEKCLFLVIDGFLNWYFIHTVQTRLIANGLTKYDSLVRFNKFIIAISLSMDVLIIGLMSMKGVFVYTQFQCLAYLIKLEIEMATSQLIVKVASSTGLHGEITRGGITSGSGGFWSANGPKATFPAEVSVHSQVITKGSMNDEQHELGMV